MAENSPSDAALPRKRKWPTRNEVRQRRRAGTSKHSLALAPPASPPASSTVPPNAGIKIWIDEQPRAGCRADAEAARPAGSGTIKPRDTDVEEETTAVISTATVETVDEFLARELDEIHKADHSGVHANPDVPSVNTPSRTGKENPPVVDHAKNFKRMWSSAKNPEGYAWTDDVLPASLQCGFGAADKHFRAVMDKELQKLAVPGLRISNRNVQRQMLEELQKSKDQESNVRLFCVCFLFSQS